jgi:hypothetical protein
MDHGPANNSGHIELITGRAAGHRGHRAQANVRLVRDGTEQVTCADLSDCLLVLPGADRAAPNHSRGSRGESKSDLFQAFQGTVHALPGYRSRSQSSAGNTWFIIDMATSMAATEVED